MIRAFGSRLDHALTQLSLNPETLSDLRSSIDRLGGLQIPPGLDPKTHAYLKSAIAGAFVYGFRIVMWICAGLSLTSAGVAWRWIGSESRPKQ